MDDLSATTAAMSAAPGSRELVACWRDQVKRFPLATGEIVLGRAEGSGVLLPDASVSRSHARLLVSDLGMTVVDLGSANGTLVDGVRVEGQAKVLVGSIVQVGAVRLVVRITNPPGRSAMDELERIVTKVAPSLTSLILVGETGAGKEVLTARIHAQSRRSGPLVSLNCAGLTATLLESELFGYERGAFTGADQAKPGLIESANRGTLFLDELAEMPESTQAKLLRVLESREVRRIGSVQSRAIDVRFVSATHRDPRTLAAIGKFRNDLLFRLNGLTIVVPPLRERRTEIFALASQFLENACAAAGRPIPTWSEGARCLVESYRWPGNLRELKNLMERVALLSEGAIVTVEHLVFDAPHAPHRAEAHEGGPAAEPSGERERLVRALAEAGGNQANAANALGITARVLGYRMDKLGIPRPRRR